ncbi:MAG: hypothetical protein GY803_07265, partial [Chloroflexi bacterium]|nr:hypothetical protein [Chloroflexota bacterium]
PLTYIWEATGQTAVTHTVSSRTDIISFTWPVTGTQTVTVTASKGTAVVSDTHTITINPLPADLVIGPLELVTPLPIRPYEPVQFRTTISNTGDIDVSDQFFVNIYFDPSEVYSDSIPMQYSDGYVAIASLAGGDSRVVTVTSATGFANEPANHQVYAMVDSGEQISEADETNNIAGPLVVNVTPYNPYITLLPDCGSGPNAQIQVNGVNWPPNDDIALYWEDVLQATILASGHDGSFSHAMIVSAPTNGLYELKAVAQRGLTATAKFAVPCAAPPTSVVISGPTQGFVSASHTFTATVSPPETTLPLTYTWEATGHAPIVRAISSRADAVPFSWAATGTYTVAVSVANAVGGPVMATHTFIAIEPQAYLPLVAKE